MQLNPKTPKYWQLAEELRHKIRRGELKPDSRLPSRSEMAARGINHITLDRAHRALEEDGLIIKQHGRGTFVNKRLQEQKKGIIGFRGIDPMLSGSSPYWTQLLSGVQEVLKARTIQLLMINGEFRDLEEHVDGLLVNPTWFDEQLRWNSGQWPCVTLLIPGVVGGASVVAADDYSGQRQATQHLLELGHRRIAYLHSKAADQIVPSRRAGYLDALQTAGITPEPRWIRALSNVPQIDFRQTGRESMAAWLQDDWEEVGCTAIMVHNDEAAIGAIEALEEAGLRVPQDVSVVGFDGTELCEYSRPCLTSVEVPLHEIGRSATEMLLQQIEDGVGQPEHITLPTRVCIRESTAPPADSL